MKDPELQQLGCKMFASSIHYPLSSTIPYQRKNIRNFQSPIIFFTYLFKWCITEIVTPPTRHISQSSSMFKTYMLFYLFHSDYLSSSAIFRFKSKGLIFLLKYELINKIEMVCMYHRSLYSLYLLFFKSIVSIPILYIDHRPKIRNISQLITTVHLNALGYLYFGYKF